MLAEEGVGGSQFRREDRQSDTVVLWVSMYFVPYLLHMDGPELPMEKDGPDGVGEEGAHHVQVLTPHPPLVVKLPYKPY